MSVVVFGGYGTFGVQVSRELARRGVSVTIAGRDRARGEALAAELGPAHRAIAADVRSLDAGRAALREHRVAVCCAGPFSALGDALLEACLSERRHYVDIADDRGYVARVRALDERFREGGIVAAFGCSSLPAISGALAQLARAQETDAPRRVRVTLFIGNDNPKGLAAIRSVVEKLGKPIAAPQGTLFGSREGEDVELPAPFGRRRAHTFESPDYELLPGLLGVTDVSVKVGYEMGLAGRVFATLAACSSSYGARTAALLERMGRLTWRGGHSGGAVLSELFWDDGRVRRASLSGANDGQRMAALPAALVACALDAGRVEQSGARAAYELLGASGLAEAVAACGYDLAVS